MAVKLRLTRLGRKGEPFYRIVAVDGKKARDGQYLECLGYYDPTKNPAEVKIDTELATKWINNGAQPTETVKSLLKKNDVIK